MFKKRGVDNRSDRRDFLKLVGVAGAATGALAVTETASAAEKMMTDSHAAHSHGATVTSARVTSAGARFFNVNESAFIEAAVDTLIPKDDVGPGAVELGVAGYIDRQMAGGYGKGDRLYLEGPFVEGTPQQGYQLPLTPSELLRVGIADVDAYALKKHKSSFASLPVADRLKMMMELDAGKIALPNVPTGTFFGLLLQLTVEGYFADPMYGGNAEKGAWKMIGFPGANAMYMDKIEPFRNKPYAAEPLGIQDLS
jgi:gluconate 2-dehydrogenase gamma chain